MCGDKVHPAAMRRHLRRESIGCALAGALLLGLGACDAPPRQSDGNAASTPAGAASPAAPTASADPALAPLLLEGHGLRLSGVAPGTELPFDSPKAATIEAVARALGRPPAERGTNDECGGGGLEFAEWTDEITVWFENDRFVGWDSKGKLKTPGGVGVGSSRADLAPLRGIEVEESTLGTEFRAGGLSGILASKAPDAKVIHLWGGSTCVFR
jgi:hypothetical protein